MTTLEQVQSGTDNEITKKEMPISAMVLATQTSQRKYKDTISDGDSSSEPNASPQVEVQNEPSGGDPDEDIRELQKKFNIDDFRAKLQLAEALAQASEMTSCAAKRRLEAKKIDLDLAKDKGPIFLDENNQEYTPPRELLIYIMR